MKAPLFGSLPRESIKNLNRACSRAKVTKGKQRELYVKMRSTVPYSAVVKIDVYNGSKKKLTICVHIFPKVIIAVFFIKACSLSTCILLSNIFLVVENQLFNAFAKKELDS